MKEKKKKPLVLKKTNTSQTSLTPLGPMVPPSDIFEPQEPEIFHEPEVLDAQDSDDLESPESSKSEKSHSLVPTTPLQRYLSEIRKYSLLTPEEEKEAAIAAYDQGDVQARHRLITANLRLVVKIALEYRRAYAQILDLIQEGNAGLVQAVNRFNPYKGVKLSTYSVWWIRAYILKFLIDNKSLVRMGTTDAQRKLFFRLRSEAEKMYALTQKFDPLLLAESIGVKEQDVIDMQQRLTKNDLSLDAPMTQEDNQTRYVDTLVSPAHDVTEKIQKDQVFKKVSHEINQLEKELDQRDTYILRKRIVAEDPITLQELGTYFNITRERARQLEARVVKKLKDRLEKAGLDLP